MCRGGFLNAWEVIPLIRSQWDPALLTERSLPLQAEGAVCASLE